MPTVITTPVQGQSFGPGDFIRGNSQLGVIEAGAHWDALVFQVGTQDIIASSFSAHDTPAFEMVLGRYEQTPGTFTPHYEPQLAQPVTGAEHNLVVRLISAQSNILETSNPIGIVWQPDPWGVAYIDQLALSSPTQGGFTETDRTVLNATNAALFAELPVTVGAGGVLELGLDQLVKGPPVDFLSEGESLLLSGRGTITRTSGATGVYAYGGRWNIETAPPGLGKLDGQAVKFEQRIAQFVVVKNRLGGGLYAFTIDDSHYDSGELTWPIPFPVRIDYFILPGVTVRWRWLLLLQ